MPQPILAIVALVVITIGLIGQASEMRRIRIGTSIGHPNIFLNKKNVKWYVLIAIGFGLAYVAQFL